ncbi:MAG: hypothetical protein IPG64_20980 [Haliea sp.]|nr:hypothetical protein [Haliea sp.]
MTPRFQVTLQHDGSVVTAITGCAAGAADQLRRCAATPAGTGGLRVGCVAFHYHRAQSRAVPSRTGTISACWHWRTRRIPKRCVYDVEVDDAPADGSAARGGVLNGRSVLRWQLQDHHR